MRLNQALLILIIAAANLIVLPANANEKPVPTLSVTGNGTIEVAPDMAIVSVGVLREAKTARAALDANNKAMAAILSAMENEGIEPKDLQTSNFNIQPRFVYPKASSNGVQKPPKIVAYVVSNNLDIRIRDINKTGDILDLVVTLGVNSGGNIQFTNQNISEILEKARVKAVKNAMGKAKTLVETAGAELGEITLITEISRQPQPVPMARARGFAAQEAAADRVPVAGGENSYQVTVSISWEIKQ